ncbi:nucleoside transporter family protein [Trichinella spiralis]|uniref:Equilibrative nucleoside transporter 1 n=1 Tax=Trichinella spiralis TaxID=6334 RepID=E5RZ13_TRISP|nr:nucleoside transporter family protein [Trichinella spiralis]KRY32056.1 Equilibrative nucleoside transporter 1 [Trichinella spiralis]
MFKCLQYRIMQKTFISVLPGKYLTQSAFIIKYNNVNTNKCQQIVTSMLDKIAQKYNEQLQPFKKILFYDDIYIQMESIEVQQNIAGQIDQAEENNTLKMAEERVICTYSVQYFQYKLSPMLNITGHHDFADTFENYFSFVGSATILIGNLVNVALTDKLSIGVRMIGAHILMIASLIPALALAVVDTSSARLSFFVITLIFMAIGNFGSSVLAGSSLGLSALYPSRCMVLLLCGWSMSGIFTSLLSIFSIWSNHGSPMLIGSSYFTISILYVIVSCVAYYEVLHKKLPQRFKSVGINEQSTRQDDQCQLLQEYQEYSINVLWKKMDVVKNVFYETIYYAIVLFVVNFVTLVCFPALASLTKSTSNNTTWNEYFLPVGLFLNFNVSDLIGRSITQKLRWPKADHALLVVLAVARIALIPALLCCNVASRPLAEGLMPDDFGFAFLITVLGFSNGYLINLCTIYCSAQVNDEWKEIAGALSAVYQCFGVVSGSIFSFFIARAVLSVV